MAAAYIEHRPYASGRHAVVSGGREVETFKTQKEAADWAIARGYRPVHVARERHLQNRDIPDHWRQYP
jgi:hypothetical protein